MTEKRYEMSSLIAYFATFFKNVIYGSTIFFTKELSASTDVLDILALRFLMSFGVMWLLKITRVVKIQISAMDFFRKNPRSGAIKNILLTAIFEPVLYMLFETLGITMTTNITAGVILSLTAVTTCIFEIIFLKENSTFLQKIFLGLGIIGSIYIAIMTNTDSGENSVAGIVFLFLTTISASLFFIFSRKSSKNFTPMETTYVSAMLGAVAFNAVNVVRHIINGNIKNYFRPYFDIENLIGFIVLAVFSTIIATAMNNFALGKLKSSTVVAFGGISTLVTIGIGVIFAGEKLEYFHIIGLSLILIRMIGVSAISIRQEKLKEKQTNSVNDRVNIQKE